MSIEFNYDHVKYLACAMNWWLAGCLFLHSLLVTVRYQRNPRMGFHSVDPTTEAEQMQKLLLQFCAAAARRQNEGR